MSAEASAERLDALFTARLRGGSSLPGNEQDTEFAPLLEAAERFAVFSQAQPTPTFARELEARMLAHAERMSQPGRQPGRARQSPLPVVLSEWSPRRMRRLRWPAVAAAMLLVGVGSLTAAAAAGPGSPLAGLSHLEEGVRLQFAQGPGERAQVHLHYAQQALDALRGTVTGADYRVALAQFKTELAAASADLATMPPGSSYTDLAAQLATLQAQARQVLLGGLAGHDWSDRLAATDVLASLGVTVPTISHVSISAPPGAEGVGAATGVSTPQSIEIQVSGTGFTPGATLYVNGQPAGTILTSTPGRLVASEMTLAPRDITSVGIGNPDGTAASTTRLTYTGNSGNGGPTGVGGNGNSGGSGQGNGNGSGSEGTHSGGHDGTPTPTPHH